MGLGPGTWPHLILSSIDSGCLMAMQALFPDAGFLDLNGRVGNIKLVVKGVVDKGQLVFLAGQHHQVNG